MNFLNSGFDHVEFTVHDLKYHASMYETMGFEKIASGINSKVSTTQELWAQGVVRILLTQCGDESAKVGGPETKFLEKHGDGVCVLAVEVADARAAYAEATKNGARSALEPYESFGLEGQSFVRAEIFTPGDIRYAFVERRGIRDVLKPVLFSESLIAARWESPDPLKIRVIDHLTNNVDMGEMKKWVDWYKKTFDFEVTRHFDIRTGRTGLISDVVASKDGKIIVPVNEATEKESQVQEFVERFHGVGVQHLAFLTTDILKTVGTLRERGIKFLEVPSTYYDEVPNRVPNHREDLKVLEGLGVLIDGEPSGYLLQLFTKEMVGPFFFEFIERKGNKGFGEGNFRALFEAIERDQVRRGVL